MSFAIILEFSQYLKKYALRNFVNMVYELKIDINNCSLRLPIIFCTHS